nr:TlpA disulfide reductase family protein [uncultured Psychroserpens sp.]
MKKITIILGVILFILIIGCKEAQNQKTDNQFVLNGQLKNIENDKWIFLIFNDKTIDSTQIKENRFTFTGKVEHPKKFNLYIKNTKNYARIWLEPGEIEFKAENDNFKDAIIKGSKSHIESEKLWKPILAYRKHRDSLKELLVSTNKISDSLKANAKLELEKVEQNRLEIEEAFIRNNPTSYVSAKTLDFYSSSLPKKTVSSLYSQLDDNIKISSYGKSISKFLELSKEPKVGDKYVDFSMKNDKGELIKLSNFDEKLILLDFWASWCGPCKAEYPALKEAYAKFHTKGFEIVSLSEDKIREDWIEAIKNNNLDWINLWQENGSEADPYIIYGINGIPDNFLIDKNGIIIGRNLRGEKLIKAIQENL